MHVVSIGEILWDVFPGRETLGGAPLNFSVNVARLGDSAALISAVGRDPRGGAALDAIRSYGLTTDLIQLSDNLPTGVALVSASPEGDPRFEIPRPAAFDAVQLSPRILDSATRLHPNWIYFGTLIQTAPAVEHATRSLLDSLASARGSTGTPRAASGSNGAPGSAPVRGFYDMNLREGHWDLPLVQRLCRLASVLKLNQSEAETLHRLTAPSTQPFSLETFSRQWAAQYQLEAVCITLGPQGCFIYQNGSGYTAPGYPTSVSDTVGAGDAFAAAFLHGYHRGWPALTTARFANALGSIVASRPGAIPSWSVEECLALASSRD